MTNHQFSIEEQNILESIMLLRRDVRGNNFINRPIADDVLDKILGAASLAPSVGFSQPWEFVIIKDQKVKQQVGNNFEVENQKAKQIFIDEKRELYAKLKLEGILESPINLAVFYKPSDNPVLGQTSMTEMGEYSVVCAVQNMWLMARALNVGIGWVSILDSSGIKEILNAPKENKLVAYLCVGYVKEFYDKPELETLNWDKRKSLGEAVYQDSY